MVSTRFGFRVADAIVLRANHDGQFWSMRIRVNCSSGDYTIEFSANHAEIGFGPIRTLPDGLDGLCDIFRFRARVFWSQVSFGSPGEITSAETRNPPRRPRSLISDRRSANGKDPSAIPWLPPRKALALSLIQRNGRPMFHSMAFQCRVLNRVQHAIRATSCLSVTSRFLD